MRLLPIPGVHRPCSDTWLLAEALRAEGVASRTVADLCAGSGALAITAARAGAARVVAVDLSLRAIAAVRANARLNGCRVEARRGDMLGRLGGERFDLIVCNPPYVPAATDVLPRHRKTTALDGGRNGRALIERLCHKAPGSLREGGVLLLVQSSVCGVAETVERLAAQQLEAEVIARARGPLGPVMARRAAMMRERRLLGEREEEELVVIRAAA